MVMMIEAMLCIREFAPLNTEQVSLSFFLRSDDLDQNIYSNTLTVDFYSHNFQELNLTFKTLHLIYLYINKY